MELSFLSKVDGKKFTLMLSLLLLISIVAIPLGFAEFTGDNYVEFVSAVDNGNGTQTWMYHVMITSPRSHWTIDWYGGPNSIVGASHDYEYSEDWGGLVNTDLHGIRFEMDTELKGMVVTYWFTLDGVYEMGPIEVGIVNASPENVTGGRILDTVISPVFTYSLTLKMEGEDLAYIVAVAETDCVFITSVTFNWFGPFETEREDGPYETKLGNPVWIDVDSELSGGFVAQRKVIEDYLGYWYVNTEFKGGKHKGAADEILGLSIPTSLFLNLPLAQFLYYYCKLFLNMDPSLPLILLK